MTSQFRTIRIAALGILSCSTLIAGAFEAQAGGGIRGNLAGISVKTATVNPGPVVRDHRGTSPVLAPPTTHGTWAGSHPRRCPVSATCIPSGNIRDHRS